MDLERYSRLMICLPPVESEIRKTRIKLGELLEVMPEFIDRPDFCGYAISWPTWTENEELKKWFVESGYLDDESETMIVEYTDDDTWEILDLVLDWSEIFHSRYQVNEKAHFTIYKDFIRFGDFGMPNGLVGDFEFNCFNDSMFVDSIWIDCNKVFRKIYRRGYFNREDLSYESKQYLRLIL